jgi:hypothetical protein
MSGHSGTLATIRASHGGCTRPELRLAVRPNLFNHVLHSTDPELMFFLELTFGLPEDHIGAGVDGGGFEEACGHEQGSGSRCR